MHISIYLYLSVPNLRQNNDRLQKVQVFLKCNFKNSATNSPSATPHKDSCRIASANCIKQRPDNCVADQSLPSKQKAGAQVTPK